MKKIIINADDCGLNTIVNNKIGECIQQGRVTSTTIMAVGKDILGAKHLYEDYKNSVSFGCHLTLDDGRPLLYDQCLADNGYIESKDGEWIFTRKIWSQSLIHGEIKKAIIKECCTQIELLLDNGIQISHLDSHHHVHTLIGLLWLIPVLGKKYGIIRYRRIRNNMSFSLGLFARQLWNVCERVQYPVSKTTDVFCSCSHIFMNEKVDIVNRADSIELMCHPGHSNEKYQEEIRQLLIRERILLDNDYELINYNQL